MVSCSTTTTLLASLLVAPDAKTQVFQPSLLTKAEVVFAILANIENGEAASDVVLHYADDVLRHGYLPCSWRAIGGVVRSTLVGQRARLSCA